MFGVAHILVSHRDARVGDGLFWLAGPANPRTPAAAAQRARELSAQARRAPEAFAALARTHSDDTASASFGGNLGVVRGNAIPAQFVDALGRLRNGEVSLVVETQYGYHILRRLQVPAEQHLSARQLVIAHRDVRSARPEAAKRTRQEARELAHELASLVARAPDQFNALIARWSDSGDAERSGDIGVWSSYEGGMSSLLLHALGTVAVGSFTSVVEDQLGFHVMLRTAVEARPSYAAAFIAIAKGEAPLTGGFKQPLRAARLKRACSRSRWRAAGGHSLLAPLHSERRTVMPGFADYLI